LTDPNNPEGRVSAHYLIDVDGDTIHLVHESDEAWHAGVSTWKGVDNVNDFSVGIELVNPNDGTPFPPAQLAAAVGLCKCLVRDYGVALEDIVGHLHIAPGRKTDPAGLDFDAFRALVAAA
jgi:N-acetylmuramoyl-L-alanine amidase